MLLPFDPEPAPPIPYAPGKFDREHALHRAEFFSRLLSSACDRIAVAGSVRREKPLVKDLEFVAIEKYPGAVFEQLADYRSTLQRVNFWQLKGPKQLRFIDQFDSRRQSSSPAPESEASFIVHRSSFALPVEIFLSQPDYFGWTLFIRTGSRDWNVGVLRYLDKCGYRFENNHLIHNRILHDIPDEETIFNLLQIPPLEPRLREDARSLSKELIRHGIGLKPFPY